MTSRYLEMIFGEDRDVAWMDDARCRDADPEIFFPDTGRADTTEQAKEICETCDVQKECLEYIMSFPSTDAVYGVWGGTTGNDRRPADVTVEDLKEKRHAA